MTSLAIGASITVGVGDSGSVVVSTNGGFGSVSVVRTEGGTTTESFGPSPLRKTFGPYGEGASVVLSNTSAGQFDYDLGPGGSGMTAAQVAALQALVLEAWMSPALQALIGIAPTRIYLDSTPLLLDNSPIFN